MRICLVAYLLDEPSSWRLKLNDYELRYEVCSIEQLTKEYPKKNNYNIENDRLAIPGYPRDKNQDYKTPLKLHNSIFPNIENNYIPLPITNYNWCQATGLGLITGLNGKNIRCIDIDGCDCDDFIDSFLEKIDLPHDYEWVIKTGSGNGYHIWIICDNLPSTLLKKVITRKIFDLCGLLYFSPREYYRDAFETIEVRWNTFCVLPPSIGPYGAEYKFRSRLPRQSIKKVDTKDLFNAIDIVGENSNIDFNKIIRHKGFWSEQDYIPTIFMCLDTETKGVIQDYKASYHESNKWPSISRISYVLFSIIDEKIIKLDEKDFILESDKPNVLSKDRIHRLSLDEYVCNEYDRHDIFLFIARQLEHVDYLLGHNLDIDIKLLRAELYREDISASMEFNHIIKQCTMKLSKKIYPIGTPYPNLRKLYKDLTGCDIIDNDNLKNNIEATISCFEVLIKRNVIKVKTYIPACETFAFKYLR